MIGTAGMAAPDIYLDACCFIYLVEGTPDWRGAVENRLRFLGARISVWRSFR